jgi:HAD superfamily hydrolase (TIGR01509 family)
MIRALVFDFDGLILDTETPLVEAWAQIHERAGVAFARAHALGHVGHVDVARDPWSAFDAKTDRSALDREHRQLAREILHRQPLLPGVKDYLEEARRRGLRLAIASNSSHPWINRHLDRFGLTGAFDLIRCREDVPRGKPEPDLYLSVLAEFGLNGAEAIAFEDSNPGSLAAKRAGLWCVAVPNPSTQHHDFAHADLQVGSLAQLELGSLLERWSSGQPRVDA